MRRPGRGHLPPVQAPRPGLRTSKFSGAFPCSAPSTSTAAGSPTGTRRWCGTPTWPRPRPVRGAMVIKPWGYGVWEQIQQELDRRIKATGHENCYFPMFIPLSFIAKEAEHVEGFAKEMAVVTHHRLKNIDGKLHARSGSQTGRAAGGAADLRDHHRRRFRPLDAFAPRPAAVDQPVGQCGALGNAAAPVPAHHRIPLAGRPHRPCHPRPRRSRKPARCWKSIAPLPKTCSRCR